MGATQLPLPVCREPCRQQQRRDKASCCAVAAQPPSHSGAPGCGKAGSVRACCCSLLGGGTGSLHCGHWRLCCSARRRQLLQKLWPAGQGSACGHGGVFSCRNVLLYCRVCVWRNSTHAACQPIGKVDSSAHLPSCKQEAQHHFTLLLLLICCAEPNPPHGVAHGRTQMSRQMPQDSSSRSAEMHARREGVNAAAAAAGAACCCS